MLESSHGSSGFAHATIIGLIVICAACHTGAPGPTAEPSADVFDAFEPMPVLVGPPVEGTQATTTADEFSSATTLTPAPFPSASNCPTPDSIPRTVTSTLRVHLPILTYHHLQYVPPTAKAIVRGLSVAPDAFEQQVAYLSAHNYHTVYFSDLIAFFRDGRPLPENPIILTFDDGWRDDYTIAFPALRKYCLVGTFFPPTNWVDHSALTLTWAQAAEMATGGMEFGSHTQSHALMHLRAAALNRAELLNSKTILETHIGKAVVAFAYPGGDYNSAIIKLVAETGYGAAVTVFGGSYQTASGIFTLHRIAIRYWDTIDTFAAKLQ
jgi:peptidoglycan/xylan/chitin deacetylase (PgdA/CDA1 family)